MYELMSTVFPEFKVVCHLFFIYISLHSPTFRTPHALLFVCKCLFSCRNLCGHGNVLRVSLCSHLNFVYKLRPISCTNNTTCDFLHVTNIVLFLWLIFVRNSTPTCHLFPSSMGWVPQVTLMFWFVPKRKCPLIPWHERLVLQDFS